MNRGRSERGRHRIWNRLQALSCQHRARRGAQTHGPRDHDLSRSRPLNWATQVPLCMYFLKSKEIFPKGPYLASLSLFIQCFISLASAFSFFNVYLFLRERDRARAGEGAETREGDTESETGSRLWAVCTEPNMGLELRNGEIVTWAEVGCSTYWATQVPWPVPFLH